MGWRRVMGNENGKRRFKDALKCILYYSGALDLIIYILTIFRRRHPCVILAYHRLVDDRSAYLDKGPVMHHQRKEFEKELAYLKRCFNVVSMDEVARRLENGIGFMKPTVAITFDDGYLDNYTLAYPALKKAGMPATIFVTTGLIGTNDRTWPDQIECALLGTSKTRVELPALVNIGNVTIRTKNEKERASIQIARALKIVPNDIRKQLLGEIVSSLTPNGRNPGRPSERLMLNWDEIKEMVGDGITIGSHSHSHPILSRMPVDEAKQEISRSKMIIEEQLGVPAKHFAFPNGERDDFSEELREHSRGVGIRSVTSLIHGANYDGRGDLFNLKRLGAKSPIYIFAWSLTRMYLKKV
jgi:peptidoglycan/xylan/chitin deacetylase (PgdA/CDA1 family)